MASYYRGAHGTILTYDVTKRSSFNNVRNWVKEIDSHNTEGITKVILANKTDLDCSLHRVSPEEGRELADRHGVHFFQVSAKEGIGIEKAFVHLTKLVLKAQHNRKISTDSTNSNVIVLPNIPVHAKTESKCCSSRR